MKKQSLKRFAAAATAITLLSGCGSGPAASPSGGTTSGGADTAAQTGGVTSEAPKETKKITYSRLSYIAGNAADVPESTLTQDAFEELVKEKLGYEIDVKEEYVHMGDYKEKLKVLMAGGSIPDVVFCGWFPMSDVNKYGDQGLYVDFTQHKDLMPNMFNTIGKDSTFADRGYSAEGKLYIAPAVINMPDASYDLYTCGAFRKDILDQHGLKVPETLDELYHAGVVLKEAYPSVYPIMTLEEWEPLEAAVFRSYNMGVSDSSSVYFNGSEFVFAPFEHGYRESVEYLNKLYSEGLIAPDYQMYTSEQGNAAIAKGEAFMIPQAWNGYPSQWNEEHPDQEWVLVPGLSNGENEPQFIYHPSDDTISASSSYFTVISNKSPVKEELMQIYDLEFTPEVMEMRSWGIKDYSYTEDANGELHIIKDKFQDPNTGTNPANDTRIGQKELAAPTKIFYGGQMREELLYDFVRNVYTDSIKSPYYDSVVLSTDENEEYANIMTAADTYANEQKSKFITGARSFDEWDTFIEELRKMGDIQKALDIKNSKLK